MKPKRYDGGKFHKKSKLIMVMNKIVLDVPFGSVGLAQNVVFVCIGLKRKKKIIEVGLGELFSILEF
jgi:hypothetical protein